MHTAISSVPRCRRSHHAERQPWDQSQHGEEERAHECRPPARWLSRRSIEVAYVKQVLAGRLAIDGEERDLVDRRHEAIQDGRSECTPLGLGASRSETVLMIEARPRITTTSEMNNTVNMSTPRAASRRNSAAGRA